jgi:hypothetical protein
MAFHLTQDFRIGHHEFLPEMAHQAPRLELPFPSSPEDMITSPDSRLAPGDPDREAMSFMTSFFSHNEMVKPVSCALFLYPKTRLLNPGAYPNQRRIIMIYRPIRDLVTGIRLRNRLYVRLVIGDFAVHDGQAQLPPPRIIFPQIKIRLFLPIR